MFVERRNFRRAVKMLGRTQARCVDDDGTTAYYRTSDAVSMAKNLREAGLFVVRELSGKMVQVRDRR